MLKHPLFSLLPALSLSVLTACSSTPYAPVSNQAQPVDTSAFTKKVDSFVVLLDTSGSMKEEAQGGPKINSAEDLVASFNSAVPPLDFKAALVTFGKGTDSCWGYGVTSTLYGLAPYNSAKFADALGSIECAASTTPITDAVGTASGLLKKQKGTNAIIIVSDFKWGDPEAVEAAIVDLKSQHPGELCLHTIKVGADTSNDALISSISDASGCGSAMSAQDLVSGTAMTSYVASNLMSPVPVMQYEKHTVSATTLFDFDKSNLKESGKVELQKLGASIRSQGMTVGDIDIIGYTDSIGSETYNETLSLQRAMAVRDYMVSEGINADIIDVSGMGQADPVASNDTAAGQAKNRRVEVHVGTSKPAP